MAPIRNFLFIMALLLLEATQSIAVDYRKCCPQNEGLRKFSEVNIKQINYTCVTAYPEKTHIYPLEWENATTKIVESCEKNANHTCIDKILMDENKPPIEQHIVKWSCKTGLEKLSIDVNNFTKCCPKKYYYKPSEHRCIYDERAGNFLEYFESRNKTLTNVYIGMMNCEDAIMDQSVNSSLYAGSLTEKDMVTLQKELNPRGRSYCLDSTDKEGVLVMRVCEKIEDVCSKIACVRKCCPDGHHYHWSRKCVLSYNGSFIPEFHKQHPVFEGVWNKADVGAFGQISGLKCKLKRYMLDKKRFDFHLSERGHLHLNDGYIFSPNIQTYCMEYIESATMTGNKFFKCFESEKTIEFQRKAYILRFFLGGSSILLLITVVIYLKYIPINLHSKTIISHCSSLGLAYMLLTYAQWNEKEQNLGCVVLGFGIIYTFLVVFSWLNIMCFDIWWTFGSFRGRAITDLGRSEDKKKFLCYSVYGWVVPLLITGLAVLADNTNIISMEYRPNIGENTCFFKQPHGYAYYTLFQGPIMVQTLCNVVFFILTVRYCIKVKLEIHKMQELRKNSFILDKTILALNMKLFFVMGLSWLLEAISSIYGDDNLFIISDIYNSMQGLPIFIIYVLKPNVIKELRENIKCLRKTKDRRISQTGSTCRSTSTSLVAKDRASGKIVNQNSNTSIYSHVTVC